LLSKNDLPQTYHSQAKTMAHQRSTIQTSPDSNKKLARSLCISTKTVTKWRKRTFTNDLSSRPHKINYVLTNIETTLICAIRKATWMTIDDIHEAVQYWNSNINRSAVHRCLRRNNLSEQPKEPKEIAKKFKEYAPGYLHIDVTYMPKIDGNRTYLFVAIDRATRVMFYKEYPNKTAEYAAEFLEYCVNFFPFKIEKILTDNGLEFTNRLLKSKKGEPCKKPSLFDTQCKKDKIEHRLTLPYTPKTNGMVERVNGTIKKGTILVHKYNNANELSKDLTDFLVYYNLYRRHGSLRNELNVKTPFDALEKWHNLEPDIFVREPQDVKKILLNLRI
jgi:transposase InsO family protein